MTEKMGFETDKRIRRKYGNVPVTAIVDGNTIHFKSKLEYRWAQYLDILKTTGEIKNFYYEWHTFYFDNIDKLKEFTPDFLVRNKDNSFEYYETKGMLSGHDIRKCKALFNERPEVKMTMVFWTNPKISAQKRGQLERFCHRVIWSAKDILKNLPIDMT